MTDYLRDDVYFCPGCGQFHKYHGDEVVNISYRDMPGKFAIEVMITRNGVTGEKSKQKQKFNKKKRFFDL